MSILTLSIHFIHDQRDSLSHAVYFIFIVVTMDQKNDKGGISVLYCFIVNRVSGNGKGLKVWLEIERLLQAKQVNYRVFFTERPKHAIEIAKDLVKNKEAEIVVAVGGDGTIHDVANGLIGSNVPLGCIPAGSGNDFSRGLKGTVDYKKALDQILSGKGRKIDIARINDESCITVVGIGFDGKVAKITDESKHKKWLNSVGLGNLTYVFSFIQVLFNYEPTNLHLTIDEKRIALSNVWLIAVANFPFYGGGMAICPEARCDDGLLDICVVHNISRWQLLQVFPKVFKGTHVFHPAVTMYSGKQIEIQSDSPLIVHGDGEIVGETPVKITIHENALHVI
jgi:diacylglycerol kinase (ATP)